MQTQRDHQVVRCVQTATTVVIPERILLPVPLELPKVQTMQKIKNIVMIAHLVIMQKIEGPVFVNYVQTDIFVRIIRVYLRRVLKGIIKVLITPKIELVFIHVESKLY
jgi:hypothetical protein